MSFPLHQRASLTRWVQSDLLKIITISSLVFVLIHFIRITSLISNREPVFFNEVLWPGLTLPATWGAWLHKPWTIITYPFVEMHFMRLLGNMIWLWIFGRALEDLHGQYRVLAIFLMGTLLGGIGWMTGHALFPSLGADVYAGSLPAVLAVGVAMLLYKPTYPFWVLFGTSIPLWSLVLVFVVINALSLSVFSGATVLMMLGGIVAGVGYNYGPTAYYNFLHRALSKTAFLSNNENFVLNPKQEKRNRVGRIVPFRTLDADMSRIDMILDKINEKGISSLSEHERDLLEKYSRKP